MLCALESLKPGKTDFDCASSNHLKYTLTVLLSLLPLSLLRFFAMDIMLKCLCDFVLIPIPKNCNDLASNENYCPIYLASGLSKVFRAHYS